MHCYTQIALDYNSRNVIVSNMQRNLTCWSYSLGLTVNKVWYDPKSKILATLVQFVLLNACSFNTSVNSNTRGRHFIAERHFLERWTKNCLFHLERGMCTIFHISLVIHWKPAYQTLFKVWRFVLKLSVLRSFKNRFPSEHKGREITGMCQRCLESTSNWRH